MIERTKLLAQIEAVPALPTAATMIMRQLRDPNVEINKVTRSIEVDPSLTTNILKLANSAIFGTPRKIGSIREAVTRVGMQKLFQLTVASAVQPMAQVEIKGYDLPAGALWRHSIRVAIGTTRLAEILGIKLPDHAFTAALLHDLGKIILSTFVNVDVKEIVAYAYEDMSSFDEAEKAVIGMDHAEVGAHLLTHWNLPEEISNVVLNHHHPPKGNEDVVVDLVHVADSYCLMSGDGVGLDGVHYKVCNEAANRLGITTRISEQFVEAIYDATEELRELMEIVGD